MIYSFHNFIKQWLEKAEHDIIAADALIEYNPMVLDVACFHSQQAAEKYLKAFRIYKEQETFKTHAVKFLVDQCLKLDADFANL